MPKLALILLAIAALGGAALAYLHFTHKARPWALTILHGLLAAAGLLLVALPVIDGSAVNLKTALIVLVVAALGGFFLFSFKIRNKPLPSAVVLIHAVVAAVGVVLLLTQVI